MQVNDIAEIHAVVQRRLYRGAASAGKVGIGQVFLDPGFTLRCIGRVGFGGHGVQTGAVHDGKALFVNGGQGVTTGLHPKMGGVFIGGVAASGNHKPAVSTIFAGYRNEVVYFFHTN